MAKKARGFPQSLRMSGQLPQGHGLGPKKRPVKPKSKTKPGKAASGAGSGNDRPSLAELQDKAQRLISKRGNELKAVKCRKCGAKKGARCTDRNGKTKVFCKQRGTPEPLSQPTLVEWFEREQRKKGK